MRVDSVRQGDVSSAAYYHGTQRQQLSPAADDGGCETINRLLQQWTPKTTPLTARQRESAQNDSAHKGSRLTIYPQQHHRQMTKNAEDLLKSPPARRTSFVGTLTPLRGGRLPSRGVTASAPPSCDELEPVASSSVSPVRTNRRARHFAAARHFASRRGNSTRRISAQIKAAAHVDAANINEEAYETQVEGGVTTRREKSLYYRRHEPSPAADSYDTIQDDRQSFSQHGSLDRVGTLRNASSERLGTTLAQSHRKRLMCRKVSDQSATAAIGNMSPFRVPGAAAADASSAENHLAAAAAAVHSPALPSSPPQKTTRFCDNYHESLLHSEREPLHVVGNSSAVATYAPVSGVTVRPLTERSIGTCCEAEREDSSPSGRSEPASGLDFGTTPPKRAAGTRGHFSRSSANLMPSKTLQFRMGLDLLPWEQYEASAAKSGKLHGNDSNVGATSAKHLSMTSKIARRREFRQTRHQIEKLKKRLYVLLTVSIVAWLTSLGLAAATPAWWVAVGSAVWIGVGVVGGFAVKKEDLFILPSAVVTAPLVLAMLLLLGITAIETSGNEQRELLTALALTAACVGLIPYATFAWYGWQTAVVLQREAELRFLLGPGSSALLGYSCSNQGGPEPDVTRSAIFSPDVSWGSFKNGGGGEHHGRRSSGT